MLITDIVSRKEIDFNIRQVFPFCNFFSYTYQRSRAMRESRNLSSRRNLLASYAILFSYLFHLMQIYDIILNYKITLDKIFYITEFKQQKSGTQSPALYDGNITFRRQKEHSFLFPPFGSFPPLQSPSALHLCNLWYRLLPCTC